MSDRRVAVFGPAYLDRVVRVDRPLVREGEGPPIDRSVEGDWQFADDGRIEIVGPGGFELEIELPADWPGPRGHVRLHGPIRPGLSGRRAVHGIACGDDLGGMGAGYAAALGGILHSALGPEDDPTTRTICDLLSRYGVRHRPIRVLDRPADWTLLVTSGEHGDKLPIGVRGCHARLDREGLARRAKATADLLVVAALPNPLVEAVLRASDASTRFLAPAMRNMADRRDPLAEFADRIHILCCNRTEWEALDGRAAVEAAVPIVAVTDGPRGFEIRFSDPAGDRRRIHRPAFPRARAPRDTNRAGEAFASALVGALLDRGWSGASRVVDESRIGSAADRAAAAAALVLDRLGFGFPSPAEIDAALQRGGVG